MKRSWLEWWIDLNLWGVNNENHSHVFDSADNPIDIYKGLWVITCACGVGKTLTGDVILDGRVITKNPEVTQ